MHNPFGNSLESFGEPSGPVVGSLNQTAFDDLYQLIESDEGHLISLRAPRAGYGKTMLLARLREKTEALLVPVHLVDGLRVDGEVILEELLTRLTDLEPTSGGLTRLDLLTRRLFAHGLLPLVRSGEVPCQDKDGTVASLRDRPTEAFDFHRKDSSIARWSKDQIDHLAPRLSSALGEASGTSARDTIHWIELLFRFSVRSPKEISRISDLMDSIFGCEGRYRTGAGFLQGLGSFLKLATLVDPVVLVLDQLDGLFDNDEAALQATSSLVAVWESCRRLNVVISINDDVWESAFASNLPSALRDRLEDVTIRLQPLLREEACALITARAGQDAHEMIDRLDLSGDDLYPRGVLKSARRAWSHRHEGNGIGESPYPPAPVRRATLPKAFDVRRIRVQPSAAGFEARVDRHPASPFLADSPFSSSSSALPGSRGVPVPGDSDPTGQSVPFSEVPKSAPEDPQERLPDHSGPPFDLSLAVEAIKAENSAKSQGLYPLANSLDVAGQEVRSFREEVRTSPFEIVSAPPEEAQSDEPQPFSVPDDQGEEPDENSKAETDAIDALLRQFRDQHNS